MIVKMSLILLISMLNHQCNRKMIRSSLRVFLIIAFGQNPAQLVQQRVDADVF